MKSGVVNGRQIIDVVAPHVGAWIEIAIGFRAKKANGVAPHVGAWIEIHHIPLPRSPNAVAPHVGAWIEIALDALYARVTESHPMWVRGLK